jgi:hypothetical protein
LEKDPLELAKYASALCMVEYNEEVFRHSTELHGCRIFGERPTRNSPRIHENEFVGCKYWRTNVLDAVKMREINKESEKIHGTYSGERDL